MGANAKAGKLNLAVLISGGGSNLQAIIDACKDSDFPAKVQMVISNTPGAQGLTRAKNAGIPAITIDHKNYDTRQDFEEALTDALSGHDIDLICLAGFMRILTPGFIAQWPRKIINTHPSLLPKFGGEGMYGMRVHQAVLDSGEQYSGSTIHYVIPEVDKGEIIIQKQVDIHSDDTAETLAKRVLASEHIAYPEAIKQIALKSGF
ncbi:MAG: phosphoribosylglycinamide formyltransferase [Micavibrio sp.]|nr:phosphoribosylglycinamide formyltransferase [Micavibrio sp.]|tara:strand:+ start:1863 stop:2477 length:615 start_codon:yes stop_codon:yes gene_type:complete